MKPASANPVATPIMACSATPTFTNWLGSSRAKSSRTPNPRSAVNNTPRLSSRAIRDSSSTAALRTAVFSQLGQRRGVLLGIHRQVVPFDAALHEVHALPGRRRAHNQVRLPRAVLGARGQRPRQLVD